MKPAIRTAAGITPLRHVPVDSLGVPMFRDIPLYNLAGVLSEHLRLHGTIRQTRAA